MTKELSVGQALDASGRALSRCFARSKRYQDFSIISDHTGGVSVRLDPKLSSLKYVQDNYTATKYPFVVQRNEGLFARDSLILSVDDKGTKISDQYGSMLMLCRQGYNFDRSDETQQELAINVLHSRPQPTKSIAFNGMVPVPNKKIFANCAELGFINSAQDPSKAISDGINLNEVISITNGSETTKLEYCVLSTGDLKALDAILSKAGDNGCKAAFTLTIGDESYRVEIGSNSRNSFHSLQALQTKLVNSHNAHLGASGCFTIPIPDPKIAFKIEATNFNFTGDGAKDLALTKLLQNTVIASINDFYDPSQHAENVFSTPDQFKNIITNLGCLLEDNKLYFGAIGSEGQFGVRIQDGHSYGSATMKTSNSIFVKTSTMFSETVKEGDYVILKASNGSALINIFQSSVDLSDLSNNHRIFLPHLDLGGICKVTAVQRGLGIEVDCGLTIPDNAAKDLFLGKCEVYSAADLGMKGGINELSFQDAPAAVRADNVVTLTFNQALANLIDQATTLGRIVTQNSNTNLFITTSDNKNFQATITSIPGANALNLTFANQTVAQHFADNYDTTNITLSFTGFVSNIDETRADDTPGWFRNKLILGVSDEDEAQLEIPQGSNLGLDASRIFDKDIYYSIAQNPSDLSDSSGLAVAGNQRLSSAKIEANIMRVRVDNRPDPGEPIVIISDFLDGMQMWPGSNVSEAKMLKDTWSVKENGKLPFVYDVNANLEDLMTTGRWSLSTLAMYQKAHGEVPDMYKELYQTLMAGSVQYRKVIYSNTGTSYNVNVASFNTGNGAVVEVFSVDEGIISVNNKNNMLAAQQYIIGSSRPVVDIVNRLRTPESDRSDISIFIDASGGVILCNDGNFLDHEPHQKGGAPGNAASKVVINSKGQIMAYDSNGQLLSYGEGDEYEVYAVVLTQQDLGDGSLLSDEALQYAVSCGDTAVFPPGTELVREAVYDSDPLRAMESQSALQTLLQIEMSRMYTNKRQEEVLGILFR